MASEMQERIARALYANHFGVPPEKWETAGSATQSEFLEDAIIAMEAMLEPTERMAEAGDSCTYYSGGMWRTMLQTEIDAAEA